MLNNHLPRVRNSDHWRERLACRWGIRCSAA